MISSRLTLREGGRTLATRRSPAPALASPRRRLNGSSRPIAVPRASTDHARRAPRERASGRAPSRRSCAPTSWPGSRRATSPSSRASSATRRPSSRPSRTRSSPARTSSSSASAARPRRAWRGCSSACSTSGMPVVARRRAQRRPARADQRRRRGRIVAERATRRPIDWLPRDRRYGEKLATPDITIADLIGEVDPIKVAEGRYLSDELTHPLRPDPAHEPRHLRDQRAARPRRADPGRPAQHPRGARRPDPRLHAPPAARPVRRRERQPRGLHEPRPDHHAAQGPARLADPDALPADARARDRDHAPGVAPGSRPTTASRRSWCPTSWRSSSPSSRTSPAARPRSASGRASASG